MALNIFWDANFRVRTLIPVLEDKQATTTSPVNIIDGNAVILEVPDNAIAMNFKMKEATNTSEFMLRIAKSGTLGAEVWDNGVFGFCSFTDGVVTIPLESVKFVEFYNLAGANKEISFMFLVSPTV